jgi:iron complex transport system permease protein
VTSIVAGRPRFQVGPVSLVWRPAMLIANIALATAALVLFSANVGLGDYPISIGEVAHVLIGGGGATERFIIWELRLPRSLVGLLVGLGLGTSGAITQSITRNPLASPDILGITAGAGAGAVAVIIFGGATVFGTAVGVPAAAMLGGLLTAGVIYLLAWKKGVEGFRLILIGIAANAILGALTTWMLVIGDISDVTQATVWLSGSLSARDWGHVWPVAIALVVFGSAALAATFPLSALKLGDETARALGVRVQGSQAVLLVSAVLLAALCVTAAGPIGFVAFVAPQLAVRLVRCAGPPLVCSALMGAALVLGSDLIARVVLPVELPVGLVTTAIGGPFLMYLIIRTNRKLAR